MEVVLCLSKHLPTIITSVVSFTFSFATAFLYFYMFDHVFNTMAVMISIGCASLFMIGFTFSAHFRCTVFVYFLQCLSHFGLFMLFISLSWMVVQKFSEDLIKEYNNFKDKCPSSSSDAYMPFDVEYLQNLSTYFHYGNLVPYVCIFAYAFQYEFTYSEKPKTNAQDEPKAKSKVTQSVVSLVKHCMWFIIGVAFASTNVLHFLKRTITHSITSASAQANCNLDQSIDTNYHWIVMYYAASTLLLIMAPFSYPILKFRKHIIACVKKNRSESGGDATGFANAIMKVL